MAVSDWERDALDNLVLHVLTDWQMIAMPSFGLVRLEHVASQQALAEDARESLQLALDATRLRALATDLEALAQRLDELAAEPRQ